MQGDQTLCKYDTVHVVPVLHEDILSDPTKTRSPSGRAEMLENFPSLTVDEFEKACKSLEEKCHDRINGTKWQSVNWNASGELNIRQMSTQSGKSIVVKRAEDDMEAEVEEDEDTVGCLTVI